MLNKLWWSLNHAALNLGKPTVLQLASLTNKTVRYAQEETVLNGESNRVYNVSAGPIPNLPKSAWPCGVKALSATPHSRPLASKQRWKDQRGLLRRPAPPLHGETRKPLTLTQQVRRTCDELTILRLSLHQSMQSTLFPWPLSVRLVFMTNCPRASTRSATWCTRRTRPQSARYQGQAPSHPPAQGRHWASSAARLESP